MTAFSRAWRNIPKNGRKWRKTLKNQKNRLNRRLGKQHLDNAPVHRHSAWDVT